ncbi:MAG: lipopolysaccharide biosynthesis protein [Proteobacteria bacterium]|nr:lipopolysaccharide biosynthesis protein [Pseudomonadota bacterium]
MSEDLENLNIKIKNGLFWIASTTIIWQLASWILTIWTARILNPQDYGLLAISDSLFPYLLMLTTIKLDEWLIQRKSVSEDDYKKTQSILIVFGIFTTLLAIIGSPIIASIYNHPELGFPLQCVALIFIPRALRVIPEVRLKRDIKFKQIALSNLTLGITRGVIQIILALFGFSFWSLIIGGIFFEITTTAWLAKVSGIAKGFSLDKQIIKESLKFGFTSLASYIFWIIFTTADNLVVGKLFGVEFLGYYSMAYFLSDLPLSKLNSILSPVVLPYYSRVKDQENILKDAFMKINRYLFAIVSPVLLGLSLTADQIIPLCFGEKWSNMIYPLQILSIVGIIRTLTANISLIFLALGKPQLIFKVTAISALVLPLCFYFLGKYFGVNGIFFSWLLIYPLIGPFALIKLLKTEINLSSREFLRNLFPPILSLFSLLIAVLLFKSVLDFAPLINLSILISVGACSYFLSYYLIDKRDFQQIIRLIRNKEI